MKLNVAGSTSFFGLDPAYALKNIPWVATKQIVAGISSLLTTIVLTHTFNQEDFGIYSLVISLFGLVSIFSLPGVNTAVLQSASLKLDKAYNSGVIMRLKWSFMGSLVLFFIAVYYLGNHREVIGLGLIFGVVFFPFLNAFSTYSSFLNGKKLFKFDSILGSLNSAVLAIFLVLFAFLKLNLLFLLFIYFAVQLIMYLIFHFFTLAKVSNKKINKDFSRYSIFMTAISGLSLIASYFDKVLLGIFAGNTVLAIYTVAQIIPTGVMSNLKNLMGIYTVKLAGNHTLQNRDILINFYWKLIAIGVCVCVFIWVLTPFILRIIFPSSYLNAIFYGQLLSLSLILFPLVTALSSAVIFEKRYKDTVIINAVPSIVRIILFVVLIPTFGILGIIISILLEKIVSALYLSYLLFKK